MTVVVQEKYRHQLDLSEISFQTVSEIEGLKFRAEVRAWQRLLREGRYDAVVFHRITRPDFPAIVAAFLENIPHRVGGAEKGVQAFLTDLYCPTQRERVVEYHWNLIRAWLRLPPAPVELRWPRVITFSSEEKRWDLLIAPFAQHTKEWPVEHWRALLAHTRQLGLRVALSAAPAQAGKVSEILTNFPEVENLAPRLTTLSDLFTHVSETRCVIAVDTGIRHVAAMLGVPCIVIGHGREHHQFFGAYVSTERYLYQPVPCAPCGAEPCPLGHLQCIRSISVNEVLNALSNLTPELVLKD
jgi:heptosyltransferase-2